MRSIFQRKTKLFILFTVVFTLSIPGSLIAESVDSGNTGSLSFTEIETEKNKISTDLNSSWMEEADKLMDELLALDVTMYTLINNVGNEDSRISLVLQRSINRKLIYDLMIARNGVIEGDE